MLIRHAVKIVIFSPVIAPHAAALQRRRYIRSPRSDVGCVIRSGVQARLVSSGGEEGKGRGERGGIQMPHSCMEITRDVKMTVRYAGSLAAEILPAANASTKSPSIIRYPAKFLTSERPFNLG